jgi:hypothetical protein
MKQVARYQKIGGGTFEVEYDDESPCLRCGEPVIGASMGGTAICGPCDMGKCRYCGVSIMVLREEVDGGASKRHILSHMKWHQQHDKDPTTAEYTKRALGMHRSLAKELEEEHKGGD